MNKFKKMIKKISFQTLGVYCVLFVFIYFPVFGHLTTVPIRIWDEARLAINAFEMYKNGNFIVTYFDGLPDMWNTKPPLMIWLQVCCIKIIGTNELAIRLPSALATFFTCIAVYRFSVNQLNSKWIGVISMLVLITSAGYIDYHASRTGDYDALLTLWITLSSFSYYSVLQSENKKGIYLFYGFVLLAILTKSIVGLMFFPGLLLYTVYAKKMRFILKNVHSYLGFIGMLLIALSYFFYRESLNPGYLEAVYMNDLGGRFLTVLDNHDFGFWFYYNNLKDFQFKEWFLLIPCGALIGFYSKKIHLKNGTVFFTIQILAYFLIISNSKTQLQWYVVPLFPFLAILVSMFIFFVIEYLKNNEFIISNLNVNVVAVIVIFLLFITPYQNILSKTFKPKEYPWDVEFYEIGYYLKDGLKGKRDVNGFTLLYEGYNAQNQFYMHALNEKKRTFKCTHLIEKLHIGDKVLACQTTMKDKINQTFQVEILSEHKNITAYKLIALSK